MVINAGASAAAILLLATALAGCSLGPFGSGSASGGASPSATRTDSVSTDDSASPRPKPGSSGGSIADPSGNKNAGDYPCNLYSLATISSFAGFTVTTANPVTAVGEPDQKSCLYDTADGSHEFAIEIARSNGAAHMSIWKQIEDTGGPVADVIDADDAWGSDSELAAVYGDIFIAAGDQPDASHDSATLANIGVDKLTLMVGGLYASTRK